MGSPNNWDVLAEDVAAANFVRDALRWFVGLDTATQESWVSLRATVLAAFGPYANNSSGDEEYDKFR